MKSLFLATAAVAALAAAPAVAQDGVGSLGITYQNTEVETFGLEGEAESALIDAAFALPVTADWTVTLDGTFGYAFDSETGGDNSAIDGRVHVSRNFGNVRVGGFAGGFALGGRDIVQNGWSFPADWNIEVSDNEDHVRIGPGFRRADHGETATRDIAWSGSDALQVDVPAEVIFTQAAPGTAASVKVTGPQALVDRVTVENGRIALRDGEGSLTINGQGFHVTRDSDQLSVEIVAPNVRSFTLNGSGDLYLKDYDQPDLVLEINGSGGVDAQGKAKKVDLRVSGSGEADLRGLETGDAKIALAGSGEAHVAPRGAAEVDVAGSGDVYLTSKPAVLSSNVAGAGEVHQDW